MLVFGRQNRIEFVRLPDGKVVLESEIHGEIKNEYLLLDRRLHFFSDKIR